MKKKTTQLLTLKTLEIMKTKILILLLTTCLFLGCNEDDNPFTLPNATQIGANTAGCYIDGDLYVLKNANTSDAWIGPSKTIDLKYEYSQESKLWYIYIYIKMEGNNIQNRQIISFKLKSKSNFSSDTIKLMKYIEGEASNSANLFGKGQTENNAGEITLTKVVTNENYNLIAGTFNFTINDRVTKKDIKVSNGRFDLKVPKN